MSSSFISFDPFSFLIDPLSHDFMRRALMISSCVGAVCGLLSCYMTLKAVSYTHLTLPTKA